MKSDANVPRILKMDGVGLSILDQANQEVTPMFGLIEKYGQEKSWSHTVIDSPSNSATLICQLPGEGNREHFHPDWDEWWYIVKGKWEWVIEGKSTIIKEGDIVFIERNRPLEKPCFCNASIVYMEQVGVNLHLLPKNGRNAY